MKFNLPAPSSVEWYRSGVPGGGQKDRIFNRLKAKLIGGKDDSGTSYFKMHDRKLSSSDADKIIANMKQDEDGYPTFSTGSTSGEAEREYQEWIIDRYLVDAPTSKPPEDIPVEIEVVEVEQKTVDEPIVVKIEAPFEPAPERKLQAPKRIRLPRRSGLMKARPIGPPREEKKSAAQRMSDAFDERLDELVDAVQNPPAPAQPKQRKQKDSLTKIKRAVKPAKFKSNFKESKTPKPFENLTAYTGLKIKKAFGRAADARRMAQEQGLPEQGKGFYAFRSLGFEFGGDRIARTRGTFSKSPDATLDPSLSKQRRYTEGLFGTRSIRPPKGGGKGGGNTKDLNNVFNKLTKKFDEVIDLKKNTPQSDKEVAEFNKVVSELKDALSKGNKLQGEINQSKKEQAKIAADAANDAEMAAKEAAMEEGKDLSGNIFSDKTEEPTGKKESGPGFNPFDFLKRFKGLRKLWKRIKNPGKTFKALKRLAGQKINKAIRPVKELAENVAGKGRKAVETVMDVGRRLRGGAADALGKAGGAIQGGLGRVGGWLSRAGDAIKGGAVKTLEATKAVGGWIGAKIQKTADLIASAPGKVGQALRKMGVPKNWDELVKLLKSPMAVKIMDAALGPVGRYIRDQLTNPKSLLKVAQRGIMNAKVQKAMLKRGGQKLLGKVLGKLGLKVGGQAVPLWGQVANLAYGVVEAIVRGAMGDLKGAALSLGGAIPWVGAGFSVIDIIRDIDVDAYTKHIESNMGDIAMGDSQPLVGFFNQVAGIDITGELESDPPAEPPPEQPEKPAENPEQEKPEEKLSAGGVVPAMVGEAGPEMILGPGGGGFNPLQSLAPMIVAMREVTKRAGTWADPIENMVRQTTDPIAKQIGLPVVPMKVDIGQGNVSEVPDPPEGKKATGFAGVLDAIKKAMGGVKQGAQEAASGYAAANLVEGGAAALAIGNDTEFLSEVTRLARKYGIKEGDLLGLMASESGLNPQARNPSGATGLIQFMPETARGLGTTTAALYGMTRAQQMKYVEKYFDYWKLPKGATAGQLYAVVFAPAYAKKDPNTPLYTRADGGAYTENAPLDANGDGVITVGEMGGRIEEKKRSYGIGGPDTASASSVQSKKDKSGHSAIPVKATMAPEQPSVPAPAAMPDIPADSSSPISIVQMPGMPQSQETGAAPMPSPVPTGSSLEQLRRLRLAQ